MDVYPKNIPIAILIYYHFRGQMQPIRNLFCYLQIPYFQIFIQMTKDSQNQVPPYVMAHFRKFKLKKQSLPALIHGNTLIEGELPIITYACRCTNRNDLLGWNIQTRVKLQEILELYFNKQTKLIIQFLKLADNLAQQTNSQIVQQQRYKQFLSIMSISGYIEPVCAYLQTIKNRNYILGQISVLDFLFLQTCFLIVGSFHKSHSLVTQINQKMNSCLTTMALYLSTFTNQPFYVRCRSYLQSFSICSIFTTEQRKQGMKKFWLGDPKFIF